MLPIEAPGAISQYASFYNRYLLNGPICWWNFYKTTPVLYYVLLFMYANCMRKNESCVKMFETFYKWVNVFPKQQALSRTGTAQNLAGIAASSTSIFSTAQSPAVYTYSPVTIFTETGILRSTFISESLPGLGPGPKIACLIVQILCLDHGNFIHPLPVFLSKRNYLILARIFCSISPFLGLSSFVSGPNTTALDRSPDQPSASNFPAAAAQHGALLNIRSQRQCQQNCRRN